MKKVTKKKYKNQKGQGMLEYVMLLAVVAAIVLVFKGNITKYVGDLTAGVGSKTQDVLNNP